MSKVRGNKNGLVTKNAVSKKSEPLVTVEKLKQTYLFGVIVRNGETGEALPDEAYQQAIDTAVSMMEHYLDLSIAPVIDFVEYKDYHLNDYSEFGYMQLDNFPVHAVSSMKLVYFRDQDGEPITVQTIPNAWLRLNNHDGIIRLIPNTRFPGNLQLGANGGYFPELLNGAMIPQAWQVTYDYGFCSGQIPVLLNQAIGIIASILVLITAGHLILGAGIASSSISIDGLSQSIGTTQSAENSGFSSTIKDYSDKLFGKTKDDPFAIMKMLHTYYKGVSFDIL